MPKDWIEFYGINSTTQITFSINPIGSSIKQIGVHSLIDDNAVQNFNSSGTK
jgi:hypothetical protein